MLKAIGYYFEPTNRNDYEHNVGIACAQMSDVEYAAALAQAHYADYERVAREVLNLQCNEELSLSI